jgi:hypothetical protein
MTTEPTMYVWPVAVRENDGTRTTFRFVSLSAARQAARLLNAAPNVVAAYTLAPRLKAEYRSCFDR